ncbi:MAG: DNA polymerase III subunit delta [Armatimonadota bacterium]
MTVKQAQKSVFIVHGDSLVLKKRAVEQIVSQHIDDEDREYGLTKVSVNETDVEEAISSLSSGSLFAAQQVVVLQDLDSIPKRDQQDIVPVLQRLSPGMTVVMTASPAPRGPASQPNLSKPLVKHVKQVGEVVDCNTPPSYSYNDQLTPWIRTEADRHGVTFEPGAHEKLVALVGENCDRLASEINKLATYLGQRRSITVEDIEEVVCVASDEDIFGLTDAIGMKQPARALELLADLVPKHASPGSGIPILAMIARHIRLLWQARLLTKHNNIGLMSSKQCPEELKQRLPKGTNIFGAIRGRKFLASKYDRQARNFNDGQLAKALVDIYNADLALKGQADREMDDRLVLERLILKICR